MSDEKEKQAGPSYDLDDILAEYGSGKYLKTSQKVVEFPTEDRPAPPPEEEPDETPHPPVREVKSPPKKVDKPNQPIPEIVPENVGRAIGAHLHTLLRKADHFADHMYDQAEPDPEALKAEKYTPGVDKEELPDQDAPPPRRPKLRVVKPRDLPPDTPPAKLAAQYQKGLKGQGVRVKFATLTALIAVLCSVELPFLSWDLLAGELTQLGFEVFQLRCWALTALLFVTGLLCCEIIIAGESSCSPSAPGPRACCCLPSSLPWPTASPPPGWKDGTAVCPTQR